MEYVLRITQILKIALWITINSRRYDISGLLCFGIPNEGMYITYEKSLNSSLPPLKSRYSLPSWYLNQPE